MRRFTCFILLGVVFSTIIASGRSCATVPDIFVDGMEHCTRGMTEARIAEAFGENGGDDNPAAKDLKLCVLNHVGYLKDGEWDLDRMKEVINTHVEDKNLAERIHESNLDTALKVGSRLSDREKAHEWSRINNQKEMERGSSRLFCV